MINFIEVEFVGKIKLYCNIKLVSLPFIAMFVTSGNAAVRWTGPTWPGSHLIVRCRSRMTGLEARGGRSLDVTRRQYVLPMLM